MKNYSEVNKHFVLPPYSLVKWVGETGYAITFATQEELYDYLAADEKQQRKLVQKPSREDFMEMVGCKAKKANADADKPTIVESKP